MGDREMGDDKVNDGTNTAAVKAASTPAAATSSQTILAANAERLGAIITNSSTSIIYFKYGAGPEPDPVHCKHDDSIRHEDGHQWCLDCGAMKSDDAAVWVCPRSCVFPAQGRHPHDHVVLSSKSTHEEIVATAKRVMAEAAARALAGLTSDGFREG